MNIFESVGKGEKAEELAEAESLELDGAVSVMAWKSVRSMALLW
jgi:hypothetical protein